jgi:hypothetical protein
MEIFEADANSDYHRNRWILATSDFKSEIDEDNGAGGADCHSADKKTDDRHGSAP